MTSSGTAAIKRSGVDRRGLLVLAAATVSSAALTPPLYAAGRWTYDLEPKEIDEGVYLLRGADEHLSTKNGGNIANIVFMETGEGVVLFDTGPSRLYGEELKQVIANTTDEPIIRVIVSHAHPDHYLGNQVFEGLPIESLAKVRDVIADIGDLFTDNMYRLVDVWMRGTRTVVPTKSLSPGRERIGRRELEFIALDGHSQADLAIYDHGRRLLLAADLVFMDRAATTPHADLQNWQRSLDQLQQLPIDTLVPGHGPVTAGYRAIEQTRGYLSWLEETLLKAADEGLVEAEVNGLPVAAPFDELAVVQEEFIRSISHLYGPIALDALEPID
ncbi:MAG: quinoprotein relay system zinc metallohydrolase 1 [Pseudomonadota bacterium]